MSQAESLIDQARTCGICISDGPYRSGWHQSWWLEPHGVTLRQSRQGRLYLSSATGDGGEIRLLEDLLLFAADPRAGYRRIGQQ